MLIKFGSIVVDGRGKLGGQVYSKNRGGAYVRNNAVPTNPRTSFQQAGRAILTMLSQGWSGLDKTKIDAWNAAVNSFKRTNVFGDSKALSGKNLFTSLNKNLIQVGQPQINLPPSPGAIVAPIDLEPTANITSETLDPAPEFDGSSTPDYLVVRATPPVSQGTSFIKNDLRVILADDYATATSPRDVFTAYENRFGTIATGQKIFIGVYSVNDAGQRSTEVTQTLKISA